MLVIPEAPAELVKSIAAVSSIDYSIVALNLSELKRLFTRQEPQQRPRVVVRGGSLMHDFTPAPRETIPVVGGTVENPFSVILNNDLDYHIDLQSGTAHFELNKASTHGLIEVQAGSRALVLLSTGSMVDLRVHPGATASVILPASVPSEQVDCKFQGEVMFYESGAHGLVPLHSL